MCRKLILSLWNLFRLFFRPLVSRRSIHSLEYPFETFEIPINRSGKWCLWPQYKSGNEVTVSHAFHWLSSARPVLSD